MNVWTLYCHTHIESGRKYIGLTSRTMERRWSQHIIQSRSSKGGRWHFPNAVRKYGKEAFSHEILAQSWTLEGANKTEEALILQYETHDLKKGFNLSKGGGSQPHSIRKNPWNDPVYRSKVISSLRVQASTPASKANRSQQAKILWRDPTYRKLRSQQSSKFMSTPKSIARTVNTNQTREYTPEIRANIAAARIGKRHSPEALIAISSASRLLWQNEKYREKLRGADDSHKLCRRHGLILISDCYRCFRSNGTIFLICKLCRSTRNKTRYLN